MKFGGIQLLPQYKTQLDGTFLTWYLQNFTQPRMIYGHWPVECTDVDDDHYSEVVGLVGGAVKVWHNFTTDPTDATYGRNTDSIAIALGGFSGATASDLGPNCATPEEVRGFVSELATLCINHRIPVGNFMSHGEAADNVDQGDNPRRGDGYWSKAYPAPWAPDPSPYGPLSTYERWDLCCRIDSTTGRLVAPLPYARGLWLPDYCRGEAVLQIQERTKKLWVSPR